MQQEGTSAPNVPAGMNIISHLLTGKRKTPTLNSVIGSDFLKSLLEDDAAIAKLLPLLPEGQQDIEGLKDSLSSPQLQQGIDSLDKAVMSEQWSSILASLEAHDMQIIQTASDPLDALIKTIIKKFGKN